MGIDPQEIAIIMSETITLNGNQDLNSGAVLLAIPKRIAPKVIVTELPSSPCYVVQLDCNPDPMEPEEDYTYYVRLVPTMIEGWTYDAFVEGIEGRGYVYVHGVCVSGIESPTPEDYARSALRAALDRDSNTY